MRIRIVPFAAVAALILTVPAHAVDPAVKCETSKIKEAGKYASCRFKAESKRVSKNLATADTSKCESKFSDKFNRAETKAGMGVCPTESDAPTIDAVIVEQVDDAVGRLSGVRYEDTGLGTVIDRATGLEWQKTDDLGGLADKDNTYSWTVAVSDRRDGTAFTVFLGSLNNCKSSDGVTASGGYAGHCDWRLPEVDELLTIVDCSFGNPCIDQSTFGPTAAGATYWTSSDYNDFGLLDLAWQVDFANGLSNSTVSTNVKRVRAVRGGS